jgi:hypothetical protein
MFRRYLALTGCPCNPYPPTRSVGATPSSPDRDIIGMDPLHVQALSGIDGSPLQSLPRPLKRVGFSLRSEWASRSEASGLLAQKRVGFSLRSEWASRSEASGLLAHSLQRRDVLYRRFRWVQGFRTARADQARGIEIRELAKYINRRLKSRLCSSRSPTCVGLKPRAGGVLRLL